MQFGKLFVISTPIGNLDDISIRMLKTLKMVSLVAAEDTRRTQKLLSRFRFHKPLLRCDENKEMVATRQILETLKKGEHVALLSDAGCPCIADPGTRLVDETLKAGYNVIPIPGPSAVTTAISVSGLFASRFCFFGFLPRKGGHRKKILDHMALSKEMSVFFESPYRVTSTLTELSQLAPQRMAFVGKELTKKFEGISRGSLQELAASFAMKKNQGEYTIIIGPIQHTAKGEN